MTLTSSSACPCLKLNDILQERRLQVTQVPTATGPLDSSKLGFTYMHEHVIIGTPGLYEGHPQLWKADEFREKAIRKLSDARSRGVKTVVDLTPSDFHRDVRFVRDVARASGMQIIVAAGIYWKSTWYFEGHPIDDLLALLVHDITQGIQGTDIRAGILKAATDKPGVTEANERALRAIARAHRQTGVPISTHTNAKLRMGLEQQAIFRDEGVDLGRVVIGHSGDTTDTGYLEELIANGSYIGMDRFGLQGGELADLEARIATVVKMCEKGYANRMVLSHDAGCIFDFAPEEMLSALPQWNLNTIVSNVIPELAKRGVSQEQIDQMTTGNPRAIFEKEGAY
jgi:phosphotriesterase-related protein